MGDAPDVGSALYRVKLCDPKRLRRRRDCPGNHSSIKAFLDARSLDYAISLRRRSREKSREAVTGVSANQNLLHL